MEFKAIWDVLKPILEVGAVGGLAVLMVWLWLRTQRELRDLNTARLNDSKEHSKELMRVQADHNREMASLIRQYDSTLTSVTLALDKMGSEE